MTAPSEQLVEWVDADGRVLAVVTRGRMRAENLRHRSVYVVVVDDRDRVVVHRRAEWKDVWAGYWDFAFGGVAGVGEPWAAAARRELAEEAGVEAVDLVEVGSFLYEDAAVAVLGRLYLTRLGSGAPLPEPADGEVVALDRVPRQDLQAWADARPVCPDSLSIMPLVVSAEL